MEVKTLLIIFIVAGLIGCSTPSQHFNQVANDLGLYVQTVNSNHFQHKIYTPHNIASGKTLHVYLDGDGTPWERNRWVSDDPTARNPLILRLMNQDVTSSILLGRPCYYGLSQNEECHTKYWTSHRYSVEVVNSMSYVLDIWLSNYQFDEVVLIGYSGGGSLAVLIAEKIKKINKVVTIAANLNVEAWSDFHDYPTLKNSLDPSKQAKLNENIIQFHFAGSDDEVVPSYIIKNYALQQKNASYYQFFGKDHACCWEDVWMTILDIIEQ